MRVVLNVNVIVSALIRPQGPPGTVVSAVATGAIELVTSDEIMDELRRATRYPHVRRLLALSEEELDLFISALEILATSVAPQAAVRAVDADPEDDKYVSAAVEGQAEYIVSGDRHLLDLGQYEGVQILNPRSFLSRLD